MTKATFGATVGLIGAFVAKSLGGWDAALITLLTLMAIDFATGLMVATAGTTAIDTVTAKVYRWRPVVTNGAIASWALTEVV